MNLPCHIFSQQNQYLVCSTQYIPNKVELEKSVFTAAKYFYFLSTLRTFVVPT